MALAATTTSSIDYCSEELCDGANHIACNNNGVRKHCKLIQLSFDSSYILAIEIPSGMSIKCR